MKNKNLFVLLAILLVAGVLRFYHWGQIPYTADELRSLLQMKSGLVAFLKNMAINDGHPVGTSLFLYIWVHLFGNTEWVVKLPFLLAGLLSVLLIYLIARDWFNETVALVSASYLATLQFTILYSQIARPYIIGLFFALAMTWLWNQLVFKSQHHFNRNLVLFIIASLLGNLSLNLNAAIFITLGIAGFIFLPKAYRRKYLIGFGVAVILYLIYLPVLIAQLKAGVNADWQIKPQGRLLLGFFKYFNHYSLVTMVAVILVMYLGLWKNKLRNFPWCYILLAAACFFVPFLLLRYDSTHSSGLYRFSVLISSFPFFLLAIFGHLKEQKTWANAIVVTVIMGINIGSLVITRQHYQVFYQSAYEHLLEDQKEALKSDKNTLCMLGGEKSFFRFYIERQSIDTSQFTWFENPARLNQWLSENAGKSNSCYLGEMTSVHPLSVPIIEQYFPHITWQKNYAGGTSYLFSKEGKHSAKLVSALNFHSLTKEWRSVDKSKIVEDKQLAGQKVYYMDSKTDYSPQYNRFLKDVMRSQANFIDVEATVHLTSEPQWMEIVTTLEFNDSTIYYSSTPFSTFVVSDSIPEWLTVHHSLKLPDINLNHNNIVFKCYIWKRKPVELTISDFRINLREGNPVLYGLVEPIQE